MMRILGKKKKKKSRRYGKVKVLKNPVFVTIFFLCDYIRTQQQPQLVKNIIDYYLCYCKKTKKKNHYLA